MINPDSSSPFSPREQTRDLSSSDPGGVVGHAAAAHCRVWLDTTWPCKAGAWSRGFYQSVVRHGRPNPFSAWPGMLEKVRMISGIRKQQPGLPGKPGKGPPDAKLQPIHLSASIARYSADGLRSGAYSLDADSPR